MRPQKFIITIAILLLLSSCRKDETEACYYAMDNPDVYNSMIVNSETDKLSYPFVQSRISNLYGLTSQYSGCVIDFNCDQQSDLELVFVAGYGQNHSATVGGSAEVKVTLNCLNPNLKVLVGEKTDSLYANSYSAGETHWSYSCNSKRDSSDTFQGMITDDYVLPVMDDTEINSQTGDWLSGSVAVIDYFETNSMTSTGGGSSPYQENNLTTSLDYGWAEEGDFIWCLSMRRWE